MRRAVAAIACAALLAGCAAPIRHHRRLASAVAVAAIVTIVVTVPLTTGCTPGPGCDATYDLEVLGLSALGGSAVGGLFALEMSRHERRRPPAPPPPVPTAASETTNEIQDPDPVRACAEAAARSLGHARGRCLGDLARYEVEPVAAEPTGDGAYRCAIHARSRCRVDARGPRFAAAWATSEDDGAAALAAQLTGCAADVRCEPRGPLWLCRGRCS